MLHIYYASGERAEMGEGGNYERERNSLFSEENRQQCGTDSEMSSCENRNIDFSSPIEKTRFFRTLDYPSYVRCCTNYELVIQRVRNFISFFFFFNYSFLRGVRLSVPANATAFLFRRNN